MLVLAKSNLEQNRSRIFLELARNRTTSDGFEYQTRKLLYQIKVHPQTKSGYAKCCEYLHRFYTETMPANMDFNEWKKVQLTEKKVLAICPGR